jgi:crossover junction endodeoxyribonuclease RuvC
VTVRIVGLDLSLTSTGYCRLELQPGVVGPEAVTITTRRIESKPSKDPTLARRSTRLRKIAGQVTSLCAQGDLVCVEGPTYASTTGAAHDRAGLWWLIVGRLTGAGLNVVEIPPANVKTYATGKGNAGKDAVLAAVVMRYQNLVTVTGNDVADALILAAMGARWIGQPIEDTIPATHLRATRTVRWAS